MIDGFFQEGILSLSLKVRSLIGHKVLNRGWLGDQSNISLSFFKAIQIRKKKRGKDSVLIKRETERQYRSERGKESAGLKDRSSIRYLF